MTSQQGRAQVLMRAWQRDATTEADCMCPRRSTLRRLGRRVAWQLLGNQPWLVLGI
jgi:hypothetical protein